jgi:hypothetical protein
MGFISVQSRDSIQRDSANGYDALRVCTRAQLRTTRYVRDHKRQSKHGPALVTRICGTTVSCTVQVHFHDGANVSSNAMCRIQCLNAEGRVGWPEASPSMLTFDST